MQKKIIITYNTSWYIYIFRKNLIEKLISAGYLVTTVAPNDNYTSKLIELGCQHKNIDLNSNSKNPFKDILTALKYWNIFRKMKPDIILNYTAKPNIYSTLAAFFCKIPTINNIAGLGSGFVSKNTTTKILILLYRFSQNKASHVFFQNEDDKKEFIEKKIIKHNRMSVLPGSGVDLNKFRYSKISKNDNTPFTFLLISRMLYSKGVKLLYEAGKMLEAKKKYNFKIQLLGDIGINSSDAIAKYEIKRWTKSNFIQYIGRTDNVRPYIEKSHCIILPTFYREGTPRSLLEGLSVGRPIITTNMPGAKDTVIHNSNGFQIKPQSIYELVDAMEAILKKDERELIEMGLKSRQLAESKFNEEFVLNAYLSKIENLI